MRALRILLVVGVILGGIFVALDRWAAGMAESEVAERVQAQQGPAGGTEVSIKGFPFLTQVMSKQLDQVDVTLKGIEANAAGRKVRVGEMTAQLHDVTLRGSLTGFSSATAARATGTANVSYEDLSEASESDVTLSYGGNGKVKVTGTVAVLGRNVTRSVLSTVSLVDGNTIRVRADAVPGEGIPGLEGMVRRKTDFDRQIGGLPDGLKLEKVQAAEGGVEISVTGTDVNLAG
ncbi:DUF2993 domain-containing protein [Streptomyces spiramyceticus]|uniref:LmeA family phospholipid-binding protein n=1 Tax=Streptomyces spiramyceticus TaxID=299717 RepID=UPI00237A8AAC|nr:DUF2993 domain-containing protein [Streptomyces spiramyceticus]